VGLQTILFKGGFCFILKILFRDWQIILFHIFQKIIQFFFRIISRTFMRDTANIGRFNLQNI